MTSASAILFGFSYKTAHYYSLYLLGALKECWGRLCLCYRKLVEKWNLRSIKLSKQFYLLKKKNNCIYLKNFSKSCFDMNFWTWLNYCYNMIIWLFVWGERVEKIFYLRIRYICVSIHTHTHTHTHIYMRKYRKFYIGLVK